MFRKPDITVLLPLLFALSAAVPAFAQEQAAERRIAVAGDTVRLDTLSVRPGSWKVRYSDNRAVDTSLFRVDWITGLLILKPGAFRNTDTLLVSYSSFPLNFSKVYQNKDAGFNRIDPPVYRPPSGNLSRESLSRSGDGMLRSTGSLSRGVAMGNARDASLTSNLNLQLEGKLNKDFRIEASLSDANVPVQPEGNTRQIQEFDRIYLRIFSPRTEIVAGDFDLRQEEGYFLRMNKRVQGARFAAATPPGSRGIAFRSATAAAVVKGKYARNRIQGMEGSQGPYPLKGANGESYIQVIAGSEKVFIDGKLLMRGEDADYTVDYNTAEIRFTPKNLITKDKRITVEFEYTERSYSRFLFHHENRWNTRQGTWYLNLYSEHDAKNQPLLQDLNDNNRQVLERSGDLTELARVSSVRESPFQPDRVLYRMADTVVNGIQYDSILIQSFHPDSARYECSFAYVGETRGNYVQTASAANGRVFRWVAPADGSPSGNYEPVVQLVTPRLKQVLSAGMRYSLGSRMTAGAEWSLTRNDLNTFSPIDDGDNTAMGLRATIQRTDPVSKDSSLMIKSFLNLRLTGARFDPAERYREVEFERDWNLLQTSAPQAERLLEAGAGLSGRDSLSAGYRLEYLDLGSSYSGLRQFTSGNLKGKRWQAGWNGSYLLSEDPLLATAFLRHSAYFRQTLGSFRLEVGENAEDNRWKTLQSSTLHESSKAFQEFRLEGAIVRNDRQPWMFRVSERTDRLPLDGRLARSGRAWDAETWFDLASGPDFPLKAGLHFRNLDADSTSLPDESNGKTLTGRIENRFRLFKGLIRSQTFFEAGSGFERKPEFSYLEVPAGQGIFSWNDYNGNGIRELNEFETAWYRDQAAYIRVFRLGTGFTPILVNRLNQQFTIQPKKGFASKFSSQLAYRIDKKTPRGDYLLLLDPFAADPSDPRLISLSSQLRHSLAFNRAGAVFSAEIITLKQSSRISQINGAEGRSALSNMLLVRYRFHPSWQLNSTTDWSRKVQVSEYFPTRNFTLLNLSELLQIECQPSERFRIGMDWEIRSERNLSAPGDLLSNRIESEFTARMPDRGQVSLSLQYVHIRFTGEADSPSGYAMLRGLGNGHNGVAELNVSYRIGKNLVLEGMYDGRISNRGRMIHNAQLQVRALF